MKEHAWENNKPVLWDGLKANPLDGENYRIAHQHLVIACHDVIIFYNGGFLLVKRKSKPAKDILWPIGGRINRGLPLKESLQKKVREECNLKLTEIEELGMSRTIFATDPFNHGKGTDTINIMFYAKGKGKLKLNLDHYEPIILKPEQYTSSFRSILHPYVQEIMDLTLKIYGKKRKQEISLP